MSMFNMHTRYFGGNSVSRAHLSHRLVRLCIESYCVERIIVSGAIIGADKRGLVHCLCEERLQEPSVQKASHHFRRTVELIALTLAQPERLPATNLKKHSHRQVPININTSTIVWFGDSDNIGWQR